MLWKECLSLALQRPNFCNANICVRLALFLEYVIIVLVFVVNSKRRLLPKEVGLPESGNEEQVREGFKAFGVVLLVMVAVYVLGFFATGGNLAIYRFWAPQVEDARREVFEQTQSYVQGKNTYIARLRLQYEAAEGPQKESLRRLVLQEAETIDDDNLTSVNRAFVNSLR